MDHDRRGLDRKNRLYSIILAVVLLAGLVGYFICMLPSLYVSYRKEQNLQSVAQQHRTYVENGNYDGVKTANPAACISIKIPYAGDTFSLASPSWSLEVTAETAEARDAFTELGQLLQRYKNGDFPEESEGEPFLKELEAWFEQWKEPLKNVSSLLPVRIELELNDSVEYYGESSRIHLMSGKYWCWKREPAARTIFIPTILPWKIWGMLLFLLICPR